MGISPSAQIIDIRQVGIPVDDLPVKKWKELKDIARSTLPGHVEPGPAEFAKQSADGRSTGFVRCKTREYGNMIYGEWLSSS